MCLRQAAVYWLALANQLDIIRGVYGLKTRALLFNLGFQNTIK
ncbi:hypothetical protein PAECIP111894_02128 [Paenibacillus pseudetheri]|uniref:Uncharacterized protein n=1 Tax=Paenibacillus pseudetheri TaxID=2897682 RepID=A0ABM9BB90_9BACL|nr:hypothetical protein PAECIP111894_02128 [Paenibacillus pseudetheri]